MAERDPRFAQGPIPRKGGCAGDIQRGPDPVNERLSRQEDIRDQAEEERRDGAAGDLSLFLKQSGPA